MFNSFGNIFRLTSFGESHGPGVGGVIDGFPAGIKIDMDFVQQELNRRRPGQSLLTTSRKEPDAVEFLSGVFEGKSTGCPIGFVVWNKNQHSNDYENIKNLFRPSHADYTYMQKYGIRDYRGGGRSSARETISRVVAGALAKLALKQLGISVTAYTSQVGPVKLDKDYKSYNLDLIETNDVRCPDPEKAKEMAEGSELNDVFYNNNGRIETKSNYSGGIQGGISNGQDIYFRVAFKPVATILMEQHTVNINGTDTTMKAKGRHDACVLPRAVPIVEAMAAMTILDYYLIDRTTQL